MSVDLEGLSRLECVGSLISWEKNQADRNLF